MLSFLLIIHNLFRWTILILALYTLYNNYAGWKSERPFLKKDKVLNSVFIGMFDLQLLLGLLLYFVYSDVTKMAFENMGAAMKDKSIRFWAVEHIMGMVIAVIVAHLGGVFSKRSKSNPHKFKKAFVYFLIAIILVLLSLPYSFHGGERPLNPFENTISN